MELAKRKAFITSTRQTVREMKDHMTSPMAITVSEKKNRQTLMGGDGSRGPIWQPSADKYTRLDRELQTANSQFIEEQQTQQQLIAEQQDEQLELVSGTIGVLKNMSQRIGQELDEQAVMLDDFSHEMDSTQSRLDNVMKKLAKVSHMTSDRRQWCAIGILLAILTPPSSAATALPPVNGHSSKGAWERNKTFSPSLVYYTCYAAALYLFALFNNPD
ncbi:Syntaxin-6 [Labeo rohita]|uniref:Syntaxin-6 n=1 Tax=Labeo rohita TaxID=84645 RepID=A0ABQ8LIN0_LABRO|nr:Syntaxin-6 [Labeo rohita]